MANDMYDLKKSWSVFTSEILWKSHGLWQCSAFSIWNCHFGGSIPLGPKVSDLDSKKPLVWSSGTGEGALGRGACSLLSWKPMDTMVFTGQKGMIIWGCPRKNKSEKKWCIASCDLKQETRAKRRTFLRTNSQKFLKYPIPNMWYWSQRLILPSGTTSGESLTENTLNWDPKLAPLAEAPPRPARANVTIECYIHYWIFIICTL